MRLSRGVACQGSPTGGQCSAVWTGVLDGHGRGFGALECSAGAETVGMTSGDLCALGFIAGGICVSVRVSVVMVVLRENAATTNQPIYWE